MSDLREWSVLANDNDAAAPDGWPEGQDKSTVNNCAREMMAALKTWYVDAEWLYLNTAAETVTKDTDTQVRIDLVDLTAEFSAGRRVKVSNGSTTVEAFVDSSAMNAGDTVVTLEEISGAGIVPAGADSIQAHIGANLGKAAWRDNGTAAAEVPLNSDLGELAYLDEGSGDCDTVDGLDAEEIIIEAAAVGSRNLLVNGDFARWQRGESFTAATTPSNDDGIYLADQWALLSDGDDVVDVTRMTSNLPGNALDGITLEWATADEEAAIYQMIEQKECQAILGGDGVASLSFQIQGGPAVGFPEKMRAAILSWNGTADSCTPDPVDDGDLDWQGAGTVPDWKAGFTLEGMVEIDLTVSWQECVIEGVAIDTGSTKNVGVVIWSEDDTIAAGSKVNIARVRLVAGERAIDLEAEGTAAMLARTGRYFWKSFQESVAPAHNADANACLRWTTNNSGTGRNVLDVTLPVPMHRDPDPSYYNPGDATPGSDYVYDFTGTDSEPVTSAQTFAHKFRVMADAPGTGNELGIHVVLDAWFF